MINVRDLSAFQRFTGLCAARIGQLLNFSNLAMDAGITHDTGLASWLLSIETEKAMNLSPMRGPLFENLIVSEMLKSRYNQGKRSNLYFWRDTAGHEVDLVIEKADRLIPAEIKSGQTVTSVISWRDHSALKTLQKPPGSFPGKGH